MATKQFTFLNTTSAPFSSVKVDPAAENYIPHYMRCAALHNEIIHFGWFASGRKQEEMPNQNWFKYHGADAEAVRSRLSPGLISFLENAIEIGDSKGFSFFYYVSGLRHPKYLWSNHEEHHRERKRFITLYSSTSNHSPDGLM